MSDRILTVTIPDWFPQSAEQSNFEQSLVEALLWEGIILHFDAVSQGRSLEEMLDVLSHFSDETLWRILEYRIPYAKRQRRRELVEKDSRSANEESELRDLIAIYNRFVGVRSQALVSLKQRGYDIERYLKEQHL